MTATKNSTCCHDNIILYKYTSCPVIELKKVNISRSFNIKGTRKVLRVDRKGVEEWSSILHLSPLFKTTLSSLKKNGTKWWTHLLINLELLWGTYLVEIERTEHDEKGLRGTKMTGPLEEEEEEERNDH